MRVSIVLLLLGASPGMAFGHHPLCGGTPIEVGWESLELYVNKVLPNIA